MQNSLHKALHCVEQNSSKTIFTKHDKWKKLDLEIRKINSYLGIRKKLLGFIKPTENETFTIYDLLGIKLLNRVRVNFSHLNKLKFRHNFSEILNRFYSYSLETESMETILMFV